MRPLSRRCICFLSFSSSTAARTWRRWCRAWAAQRRTPRSWGSSRQRQSRRLSLRALLRWAPPQARANASRAFRTSGKSPRPSPLTPPPSPSSIDPETPENGPAASDARTPRCLLATPSMMIRAMLRTEVALKHALVKAVTYESTEAELAELGQCYKGADWLPRRRRGEGGTARAVQLVVGMRSCVRSVSFFLRAITAVVVSSACWFP